DEHLAPRVTHHLVHRVEQALVHEAARLRRLVPELVERHVLGEAFHLQAEFPLVVLGVVAFGQVTARHPQAERREYLEAYARALLPTPPQHLALRVGQPSHGGGRGGGLATTRPARHHGDQTRGAAGEEARTPRQRVAGFVGVDRGDADAVAGLALLASLGQDEVLLAHHVVATA